MPTRPTASTPLCFLVLCPHRCCGVPVAAMLGRFILGRVMESSLSAMCKKFGNFSESLTAIYMTQVRDGYVVHENDAGGAARVV